MWKRRKTHRYIARWTLCQSDTHGPVPAHERRKTKGRKKKAIYTYIADKSSRQCNEHKCKVAAAPMSASSDVMAKPKILAMKRTIVHVYTKCVFRVTTKWTSKAKGKQSPDCRSMEMKPAAEQEYEWKAANDRKKAKAWERCRKKRENGKR